MIKRRRERRKGEAEEEEEGEGLYRPGDAASKLLPTAGSSRWKRFTPTIVPTTSSSAAQSNLRKYDSSSFGLNSPVVGIIIDFNNKGNDTSDGLTRVSTK